MISPAQLASALVDPVPEWSIASGVPFVVVDGDATGAQPPAAGATPPPAVFVARVRGPVPAGAVPLIQSCDVIVADDPSWCPGAVEGGDDDVSRLDAAVDDAPAAAVMLCQLLRGTGLHDVAAGLLSESLAYGVLQGSDRFGRWLGDQDRDPADDHGPTVISRREGDTLRITLARPEMHNALDVAMRDELVDALAVAATDPAVERVVLDGQGASFCSGGDLSDFGGFGDPAAAHLVRSTALPARALARVADRVHARVHGACIGAGVELAAFAWEVEAAPDATFRLPEVAMGLVPGSGGTVSLPRRIGRHRTAWLALSGATVDVRRALRWGLVDRIAEPST